jgi:FAD:protein FMN transferase
MNRRDFLDTGRMARTAGQLAVPWFEFSAPQRKSAASTSLLRFSRRAMATSFELLLSFSQSGAAEVAGEALDLIDELEAQLTVYRDDSEVALLNQLAAREPVVVEDRLFGLLSLAARITAETGGAFDITSGPLIKAWGFFRRHGRVPTPNERQKALDCVGMRHVELNAEQHSVRFLRPGIEINLGSIGKGYALDRCKDLLRSRGVHAALLHGGGSSVLAVGSQPGAPRGWSVNIRHPWYEGQSLGIVSLRDRAIGTSAATFQHFEYNRRKLGHLLDPGTGWPAEGMASVSVLAPTAAEADALATAFFVLGIEKTRIHCRTHPEIGAVLLAAGNGCQPVVLGLTPNEFAPACV